jgi:recombination protein RecA
MSDIVKKLKSVGLLSDHEADLGYVSTGSYALNKICSGSFHLGLPIGYITQFRGESSTAKTVFVTSVLAEATKQGYWALLIDSENAYNPKFAESLGINPDRLYIDAPPSIEDCFDKIEKFILEIREEVGDKETPIVIGYDSIAVSPCKVELEGENYDSNNMVGAMRAKVTGSCLRRINTLLRKHRVCLMIINQVRNKVGVFMGDPRSNAAGGKALDYYLGINLETLSANSEKLKDPNDKDRIIGIRGRIKNTKNKVTVPFQETSFELLFDKGLTKHFGVLDMLVKDGVVERSGAWYTYQDQKFQAKLFNEEFSTGDTFKDLREALGL